MYCACRIPVHLRCTQCSILLHLMDICCLTCICLWQISQIQTCLFKVIGPGLVSRSPAFVISSASHPAGRHAQKTGNGKFQHTFAQQLESAVTDPPLVGCVVWVGCRNSSISSAFGTHFAYFPLSEICLYWPIFVRSLFRQFHSCHLHDTPLASDLVGTCSSL